MRWENDNDWSVGIDSKAGRDLFKDTIPEFAWKD
jgi:hypothetical protein